MVSKPIAYLGSRLFYGSVSPSFQLFPSLKILSFKGILEWEESTLIRGTSIEFPSLSYLSLKDCLKLKGTLPNNLPSIDFKLSGCPLLVPMSLSLLHDLIITHCPDDSFSAGGLPTPNLIHLHMSYYDKLSLLSEPINTLASLQGLNIGGLPNL
ncbi:hypothetical protein JHK87_031391 [Glycine soja]|nr:hypothetical protein JHK87_031391 [Glycine soja]